MNILKPSWMPFVRKPMGVEMVTLEVVTGFKDGCFAFIPKMTLEHHESQLLIGDTSSNGCFSIVMLVFR